MAVLLDEPIKFKCVICGKPHITRDPLGDILYICPNKNPGFATVANVDEEEESPWGR